jgi:hypothetical protein
MLTGKLRNQVGRIWEAFWTGGITLDKEHVVHAYFSQRNHYEEGKINGIA